jgi:hypothetical protein
LDAVNTTGGVLLLWDRRVLEKSDSWVGRFLVSSLFKCIEDGFEWVCTGFYGLNDENLRSSLWDELRTVRERWAAAWS